MPYQKSVLIVDDEPIVLEFLDICLTDEGYRVERASNGLEAIKMAETREYHAIVTDIKMPAMDGIRFYEMLKDTYPFLSGRVIFISGYINSEKELFIKSTGRPLLQKPFSLEALCLALKDLESITPAFNAYPD